MATATPIADYYPSAAVLGAFSEVCQTNGKFENLTLTAQKYGWATFTPNKNSALARSILMIGAPLAGGGPDPEAVATLRKDVAGRHLELLLVHYGTIPNDPEFAGGFACHVIDYDATRPLDSAAIRKWAGRTPLKAKSPPPNDNQSKVKIVWPIEQYWKPGILAKSTRTNISFVPRSSFLDVLGGSGGIHVLSVWNEIKGNK